MMLLLLMMRMINAKSTFKSKLFVFLFFFTGTSTRHHCRFISNRLANIKCPLQLAHVNERQAKDQQAKTAIQETDRITNDEWKSTSKQTQLHLLIPKLNKASTTVHCLFVKRLSTFKITWLLKITGANNNQSVAF